jgi:hypothetical protein
MRHKIKAEWYIAAGQVVLALCLLVCLIRIPHYFFSFDQGGVSNFGTEPATRWLFTLGFAGATLSTVLGDLMLPRSIRYRRQLRVGLYSLAGLYLAVLFSTFSYKVSNQLRDLHQYTAISLFLGMLTLACWLRVKLATDPPIRRAFIVFCWAFAAGTVTVLGLAYVLFDAEVVCGAAFGYLLVRGVSVLQDNPTKAGPAPEAIKH